MNGEGQGLGFLGVLGLSVFPGKALGALGSSEEPELILSIFSGKSGLEFPPFPAA